ncbi:Gfo/Idh/MocA family protein [Pseudoalteromonas ardens]|uniref:Gfo/Idh/MocA family protein n=1 Tax=Pseudoalteromonas ardens TaxID=3048490 RepID=UPI0024C43C0C|nr:Gfo/Idh/MocA family oxidoreductase [Pseudoalteromonas sp. R96]MDK1309843.1 Gfo/Idh/MocA family oxidoreductase [Pseudoalteromonas sp. R96]
MITQFEERYINNRLNVIIIGVGNMGAKHLNTVVKESGCNLIAIYDVVDFDDLNIEEDFRKIYIRDFDVVMDYSSRGVFDSAIISCPTILHYKYAKSMLEKNVHCLIEKPACTKLEEAEQLIELSVKHRCKIAVSHPERFNTAFISILNTLKAHSWDSVRVSRLNPSSMRLRDNSVVFDLMIHDIDLIANQLEMMPKNELQISATSIDGTRPDFVSATYQSLQGSEVEICCGRLPGPQVRQIEAEGKDGFLHIDLLRRSFVFKPKRSGIDNVTGVSANNSYSDSLTQQLKEFIHLINGESAESITSIYEARNSLALCDAIERKAWSSLAPSNKEFA